MSINYLEIIGEYFPGSEAYTTGAATDYNNLIWVTTPIPQVDLDARHMYDYIVHKIIDFSILAKGEIIAGFESSALGFPHWYDSQTEDQLNLIGAVTTGVTMPYSCRAAISGLQEINLGGAKLGTDPTGFANSNTTHNAEIIVDGVSTYVSITGTEAQTIDQLLTQIQSDLDLGTNHAMVELENGNLHIHSHTYDDNSTIQILDSDLFVHLSGYIELKTAIAGVAACSTCVKEYKIHSNANLITVINDGKDLKLYVLQKFNVKKAQIAACTSVAEVDAITW